MNLSDGYVEWRSESQISNAAQKIRATINNTKDFFDILYFIEYILPQAISNFSLRIIDEDDEDIDMTGIEAATIIGEDSITIYLREATYDGARHGNGPNRFTIAHEVGHVILHSKDKAVLARFTNSNYERRSYDHHCNAEVQANIFAAELLAPSMHLNGLTIKQIMSTYNVSRTVAEIQKRKSRK